MIIISKFSAPTPMPHGRNNMTPTTATIYAKQTMSTIRPSSLVDGLRVLVIVATIVCCPVLARNPSNQQQQQQYDLDKIQESANLVKSSYSDGQGEAHKQHAPTYSYNNNNYHHQAGQQHWAADRLADDESTKAVSEVDEFGRWVNTMDSRAAKTTRTYERVVLEGSRVSISCPHSKIIVASQLGDEKPAAGHQQQKPSRVNIFELHDDDDEQKQQIVSTTNAVAPTEGARHSKFINNNDNNNREMLEKTQVGQIEQVRWFRNYVPLLGNSNHHFPHWQRHQKIRPDSVGDTGETAVEFELEQLGRARGGGGGGEAVDALEDKSNWTTKLSQTTTTTQCTLISGSDISSSKDEEQWQGQQLEQKLANQFQETSDSSSRASQNQDSGSRASRSGGGNVNKLVGNRKLENSMPTGRTGTVLRAPVAGRQHEEGAEFRQVHEGQEAEEEEEPRWYTNEFGELVISRVTLYFAGKYTCLVAGQRSEVLLDVLQTDTKPSYDATAAAAAANGGGRREESQQALKMFGKLEQRLPETIQAGGSVEPALSRGSDGISRDFRLQSVRSSTSDNDDETGSEDGKQIENEETTATLYGAPLSSASSSAPFHMNVSQLLYSSPTEPTNTNSLQPDDDQLLPPLEGAKENGNGSDDDHDNKLEPYDNNSQVDKSNPSPASTGHSIKTTPGGSDNITTTNLPDNNKLATVDKEEKEAGPLLVLGGGEAKILDSDLEFKEAADLRTIGAREPWRRRRRLSPPVVGLAGGGPEVAPVHIVNTEAIQVNDLKLVPGFLYTRQQLFCPIAGLTELHLDHINPIIHELCPPSPSSVSTTNQLLTRRCHMKAEQLIRQIVGLNGGGTCAAAILDLIWLKDGKQLEFDSKNGRTTDSKNVNLKLIDNLRSPRGEVGQTTGFPYPSSSSSSGLRSNDKQLVCLPGGRSLEIDGIRKESGGRYTCALKLSIKKFQKILQNLGELNITWSGNNNSITNSNNNDILLPSHTRFSEQNGPLIGSKLEQSANDEQFGMERKIVTPSTSGEPPNYPVYRDHYSSGAASSPSPSAAAAALALALKPEPEGDRSREVLSTIVASNEMLDSILNGSLSSNISLDYIGKMSSRAKIRLKTIQSFSVVVAERAANSCDLWSTILEAGNAYTRRKLADFKRLKRSNGLQDSLKATNGPAEQLKLRDFTAANTQWNKQPAQNNHETFRQQAMTMGPKDSQSIRDNINANQSAGEQLNDVANIGGHQSIEAAGGELSLDSNEDDDGFQWRRQADSNKDSNALEGKRLDGLPNSTRGQDGGQKWTVEQEVEGPLYGWRPISGAAGDGSSSVLVNNSDRSNQNASASIANNYNNDNNMDSPDGLGQTMIHAPESARPFNYANERIPKPLYVATSTGATNSGGPSGEEPPIVASSGINLLHSRPPNHANQLTAPPPPPLPSRWRPKRSPMIKGQQQHYPLADVNNNDAPKDLIMQRGRRRRRHYQEINGGRQRGSQVLLPASGAATGSGSRGRHPTVIDGTYTVPAVGQPISLQDANDVIDYRAKSIGYRDMDTIKNPPEISGQNYFFELDGVPKTNSNRNKPKIGDDKSGRQPADNVVAISGNGKMEDQWFKAKLGDKLLALPGGVVGFDKIRPRRSSSSVSSNQIQDSQLNIQTNTQSSYLDSQASTIDRQTNPPGSLAAHYGHDATSGFSSYHQSAGDSSSSSSRSAGSGDESSIDLPNSGADYGNVGQQQPSSGSGADQIDHSFTEPATHDLDGFEESLMWTAGQYLYMHMQALASSSMFGVEVAVEWSNERSNGTNMGYVGTDRSLIESSGMEEQLNGHKSDDNHQIVGPPNSRIVREVVPFATIDVISGQNLQLQCTAQALGRLPEVKWYKKINSIPGQLKGLTRIARKIGSDLYWPLTELDILNEYETPPGGWRGKSMGSRRRREGKSFVCSQTTAIFDNLANQTFTVVSSLKLSQYNDFSLFKKTRSELDQAQQAQLPVAGSDKSSYNLYACIVDADVRHNYATLGVHFREAPSNKISSEISKRLGARFALATNKLREPKRKRLSPQVVVGDDGPPKVGSNKYTNFDLYRQNQLQFPLKPSHWIPIQNGSSYMIDAPSDGGSPLTPAMLSTVILFVFGSLVGLMYLTLRTYRNLTLNQLDEEEDEELTSQFHPRQPPATDPLVQDKRHTVLANINLDTRCPCLHLVIQNNEQQTIANQTQQQEVGGPERSLVFVGDSYLDEIVVQLGLDDTEFVANNSLDTGGLYYQAHTNEPHECACRRIGSSDDKPPTTITVALPSEPNNKLSANYSGDNYHTTQQQQPIVATNCYQPSSSLFSGGLSHLPPPSTPPPTTTTNSRSNNRVNLVENPMS